MTKVCSSSWCCCTCLKGPDPEIPWDISKSHIWCNLPPLCPPGWPWFWRPWSSGSFQIPVIGGNLYARLDLCCTGWEEEAPHQCWKLGEEMWPCPADLHHQCQYSCLPDPLDHHHHCPGHLHANHQGIQINHPLVPSLRPSPSSMLWFPPKSSWWGHEAGNLPEGSRGQPKIGDHWQASPRWPSPFCLSQLNKLELDWENTHKKNSLPQACLMYSLMAYPKLTLLPLRRVTALHDLSIPSSSKRIFQASSLVASGSSPSLSPDAFDTRLPTPRTSRVRSRATMH